MGDDDINWDEHLNPCRKCGGKAEMYEPEGIWYSVRCTQCPNDMKDCRNQDYKAAKQWNDSNPPTPRTGGMMRVLPPSKEQLKLVHVRCSLCDEQQEVTYMGQGERGSSIQVNPCKCCRAPLEALRGYFNRFG